MGKPLFQVGLWIGGNYIHLFSLKAMIINSSTRSKENSEQTPVKVCEFVLW